MKLSITFMLSIILVSLFSNCATSQFDKNPSFTINKAQYQKWIGGKPGSNGTIVTIEFAENIENTIQFDSIYFNNKSVKLNRESVNDKTVVTGNFKTSSFKDKIIIMDKDPKKEIGNELTKSTEKLPFLLSKNECVISYLIKNKEHYYKVSALKKGKTIIYQ